MVKVQSAFVDLLCDVLMWIHRPSVHTCNSFVVMTLGCLCLPFISAPWLFFFFFLLLCAVITFQSIKCDLKITFDHYKQKYTPDSDKLTLMLCFSIATFSVVEEQTSRNQVAISKGSLSRQNYSQSVHLRAPSHLTAVMCLFWFPGIFRCHQVTQPCVQILHQWCRATPYPAEDHRARWLAVHPCYEWTHFLSWGETIISALTFSTKLLFHVQKCRILLYAQNILLFYCCFLL